jgi:hypothetical protein
MSNERRLLIVRIIGPDANHIAHFGFYADANPSQPFRRSSQAGQLPQP